MRFTPVGIEIGPLSLSFFGLIVLTALIAGGYYAQLRARRMRQDMDIVTDLLMWGLVVGVIVGRIFYVWNPPPSVAAFYDRTWFLTHPFDLQIGPLAIWSGGLDSAGALPGGLIGAGYVLWRKGVDRWLWADILAPAALLGLTFAPIANLVNQQMYGPPASLPWAVFIQNPISPYATETHFHPTPGYLALWALICLITILWIEHQHPFRKGNLALATVFLYSPGLFAADFVRLNINRGLLGLTGMQWVALLMIGTAGALLYWRRTYSISPSIAVPLPPHSAESDGNQEEDPIVRLSKPAVGLLPGRDDGPFS
jgi:phosphatidylglycerol---prolipoprotein diacylglyceryl transferase